MPSFSYTARNSQGAMVTGTMDAADERAVAVALRQLGQHLISVEPASAVRAEPEKASPLHRGSRVDKQETLILLRELASLVKAGIPLGTCLNSAAEQAHSPGLKSAMTDITQRVHGGSSFSEAMGRHPRIFSDLATSMVRVGETAGILDQVLDQLARLGTQELETRSRVRSALIYPIVLIGFALTVVYGLLVGVLPRFVSVFETSQIKLPWPTRTLLFISSTLKDYWWLIALGLVIIVWWIRSYYATPHGRKRIDAWLLKAPLVGPLYSKITVMRITRTLGSMLKTGVPMLEALAVAEKTVPNVIFRETLRKTQRAVAAGRSFSEPIIESGLFPRLVIQLVTAGEKSGQLDTMLLEAADFYEPEVEVSIRNLTTLLEPVLLLVMGAIVGFIALSVLLPIFSLIHAFRQ